MFGAQVTVTVSDLVGIVMSLAVTGDVMIAAVTRSIGVFKTTVAVLRAVEMDSGISRGAQRHIAASFCSAEASTGHHPSRGRHFCWVGPRRGVSNLDWSSWLVLKGPPKKIGNPRGGWVGQRPKKD